MRLNLCTIGNLKWVAVGCLLAVQVIGASGMAGHDWDMASGTSSESMLAVTVNCPPPVTISCDVDPLPDIAGEAAGFTTCQVSEDVVISYEDNTAQLTSCSNTGSLVRTWTATDACGESVTCVQVITIEDVTAPTIMCPSTSIISCEQDTSPASLGMPFVSDNCADESELAVTYHDNLQNLQGCNGTGSFLRLWQVADACGNQANCAQTILISDDVLPDIVCPPDLQVNCTGSIDPAEIGPATASDNCTPVADLQIDYSDNLLGLTGCNGTGIVIRSWAASDACGNMSMCTQVITVVDEAAPAIECPADLEISCADSSLPSATGTAAAEDDCGIVLVDFEDQVDALNGCNGTGILTRTWTATDGCGNSIDCIQTISITDNSVPVIECPSTITVDCSLGTDPAVTGEVFVTDNCTAGAALDISYVDEPGMLTGCNGTGTFQRTWNVSDACGNATHCTQVIHVTDESAPSIACPEDIVVSCSASLDPSEVGTPVIADNCTPEADLQLSYSHDISNANGCNGTGVMQRTWLVLDACGNSSSCVQNLMLVDDVQPEISCAAEVTITCTDDTSPEFTGWSTASDNCTPESEIQISFVDTDNLTGCNGTGTLLRTWTSADLCGNSISCTQIIHVVDETKPVIECPEPATVGCNDSTSPDALGYPAGTDECTPAQDLEIHYADNLAGLTDCMGTGEILRNWTVLDACGNLSSCTQTITVSDANAPEISCPADAIVSCEDDLSTAALGTATAVDDCTPAQMIAIVHEDNTGTLPGCNGTGILVRTWSATDACGNEANCTQTIQVRDETAPEIQCPASLTFDCAEDLSPEEIGFALVSDNCSPGDVISLTFSDDDSGLTGCNGTGNKYRTWTAIDLCGNAASCVQTMTIVDTNGPDLTCPENAQVGCGTALDPSNTGNIIVADNCTPFESLLIQYDDAEQGLVGCNGSGSIVRTWTVEDACGNVSTCVQQIAVVDDIPPVIACQDPVEIECGTSQDTSAVKPPAVTDNCSAAAEIQILYFDNATGLTGCNGSGTLYRNWIAFDECGNMSSCNQVIEVVDNKPPVIEIPAPVTVSCELADDLGVLGQATAVDNCSDAEDVFLFYEDIDDGLTACNGTGLKRRMWIAMDGCGNIDTAIQEITLIDTLAPLFYCPLNISVGPDADIYDFDKLGEVQVLVDNCAPVESVEIRYEDDIFNLTDCAGSPTISRKWYVNDPCGNIGTCIQYISVAQYNAPAPTFPADLEIPCEDDVFDMSRLGEPELPGGVAGLLIDTVYYTDVQFAAKENGFMHMREWYVADYCQHVTRDTQYIQLTDESAPEMTLKPMTVDFKQQPSFTVSPDDVVLMSQDNCTPEISFSIEPAVLTCEDFITTNTQTITVTATDDFGNETVLQTEAVVADPQVVLSCPSQIFVQLDPGECSEIVDYTVTAVSPCGPDPELVQTDDTQLTSGDYFPMGQTILTYEATDALGASVSCSITIEVEPYAAGQFLVCNDLVNVSVNESCEATLTPDIILEGDSYGCYDQYRIYSEDPSVIIIDGILQGAPQIGETFQVCIEDTMTNNFCCTEIFLEDKLPPVLECQDVTISCSESTDPAAVDAFPVPGGAIVSPLPDGRYAVTGNDNCQASVLEYEDESEVFMCEGDYIRIITRTWTATDASGNTAGCVQTLYLQRGLFEDIVLPADTVLECNDPCILPDGTTDPACTGEPTGDFCDQFFYGKTDKIINGCGGTYAIKRTWKVVDWCNPDNLIEHVQIINIDDTQGPVLACPDTIQVPLDPAECTSTVNLVPPAATDACMSDSITFVLRNSVETYTDVNGVWTIEGLEIGTYHFQWQATDACGNITLCDFVLEIVDNVPPVAYCDQHTVVAISNEDRQGVSVSPAIVFDDGSFDACSDVAFRVRRMDSCIDFDWTDNNHSHQPDGVVNGYDKGTLFDQYVPFSCCDVASGEPVMVQLEVTDEAGNVNYCMVEVTVQDKIAPKVTCPPDIEVSCQYWFDENNLDELTDRTFGTVVDGFYQDESDRQAIIINDPGNPEYAQPHTWGIDGFATDNCNMNLSLSVSLYDDCSGETLPGNHPEGAIRLIERNFLAVDPSGKSSFCRQHIWIVNYDPFYINPDNPDDPGDDVIWPADLEVDHCGIPDTIYPILKNTDCGTIATNLEEQKFYLDEGSCMKILRHWTVIDWCQYNSITNEGIWEYTQVVKITDDASAVFTDCPDETVVLCSVDDRIEDLPTTIDDPTPCAAHVNLEHVIEDVCSRTVTYDVKVYPFNGPEYIQVVPERQQALFNGSAVITFDSKSSPVIEIAQGGLPYNDPFDETDAHRVLWTVLDACGNISTCSYLVRLEDCKQPSPVCINGLSTVVMPSNGEITIWADDFDAGSYDNCTSQEELLFSFSGEVYQPGMKLTCDNIPFFGAQFPVKIHVWDSWGNHDYCSTMILVHDNDNVCGQSNGGLFGNVSTSEPNIMVGNASVVLSHPNSYFNQVVTAENGYYAFPSVPEGNGYEVSVERNDNPKNGVSSLDLIRIQKHLLSTEPIVDPYDMIAADINNNGAISAVDMIELRKLILGVYTEFPDNKSWRFVPKSFEFTDPYAPWPFDESVVLGLDSVQMVQEDFVGVKIGDLNNTVVANAQQVVVRNAYDVLHLAFDNKVVSSGQEVLIPVRCEQTLDLSGIQFTLESPSSLFAGIEPGALPVSEVNFALVGDKLTFSWTDVEAAFLEEGDILFSIRMVAGEDGELGQMIRISSEITEAEAYDGSEQILDIALNARTSGQGQPEAEIALFQNQPNPFDKTTMIGFEIPERAEVALTVFNMAGQLVHQVRQEMDAGLHQIEVTADDLRGSGVYYYTLQVGGGHLLTKKMVFQPLR